MFKVISKNAKFRDFDCRVHILKRGQTFDEKKVPRHILNNLIMNNRIELSGYKLEPLSKEFIKSEVVKMRKNKYKDFDRDVKKFNGIKEEPKNKETKEPEKETKEEPKENKSVKNKKGAKK